MLDKKRNAVNFENVDIVLEPPCNSYTNEQLNCPFTGKATAAATRQRRTKELEKYERVY